MVELEAKIIPHKNGNVIMYEGTYFQSESADAENIDKATHFNYPAAVRYLEESYPNRSPWYGHWVDNGAKFVFDGVL
jgi:hypothetical protein